MLQKLKIIPCAFILFSFGFTLITVVPVFAQTVEEMQEKYDPLCQSAWERAVNPNHHKCIKVPPATCYNKFRDSYWDRVSREKGLPPCSETPPVDRIHTHTQKCLKKKVVVNRVTCVEYEVNKNWNRMAECMSTGRWKESVEELKRRCETECKGPQAKTNTRCLWDSNKAKQ